MWAIKKICNICHKSYSKSKLREYETIQGNRILSCERCSKYIKPKSKN